MRLAAGSRLGPYEILSPLGAGGMGEVYRARDTRLSREVAVKVLPAGVSADPDRLKRFEKEARAASSLNHPNIVTVYDIGETGGTSWIAMELVEGRTLRELLGDGPIPIKRLLTVAAQAGDGLAKAHGAGIVHRDLKPENLMVTPDGFVKILDFGLAKLTAPEDGSGATAAPTVSGGTEPGIVMGTVGYMSPEQALGKVLDFRSDQFSLGSILYEMATGKRAFQRGSTPETLSAIIRDEPEPMGTLSPISPVPLRWIVERCLAKNPDDRYASTRDLARDLATLKDRLSEATSGASAAAVASLARWGGTWFRLVPWALVALLGLGLMWRLLSGSPTNAGSAGALRFSVTLPEGVALSEGDIESHSAISPDGRWLVFVGTSGERERLYLRSIDSLETRPLSGTEGAITPFWSPDSRHIGFFADGKIKKIAVGGGPPQIICSAGIESLPSWGSAGEILFIQFGEKAGGLWVVSASGGEPRRLLAANPSRGEIAHLWPHFLPDGKRFLFMTMNPGYDRAGRPLRLGSLGSPSGPTVAEVSSRVEYALGHLLFVREGVLLAQPFDEKKLRVAGEPVALAEHVYQFNGPLMAGFSASQTGVVIYEPSTRPSRISWLDRTGRELEKLPVAGAIRALRLSPDGRSLAMGIEDEKKGSSDIWTYDFERRLPARVTLDPRDEKNPVWSADGQSIFFRADWMGPPDIYRISVRSPESAAPVVARMGVQFPEDVSRDGRFLVFTEYIRRTNGDLWLLPLSRDGKPVPISQAPFDEKGARFSPDSGWLAYDSNESGSREVYLRPVEASGERLRVSSGGGTMPRWRRDGRELYYLAPDNTVMAVALTAGTPPQPAAAAALFRVEGVVRDYDVAADGQRFLVDVAEPDPAPISVLVNWPALMKK